MNLDVLRQFNSKRSLGVKRWDYIIENYENAGSVVLPLEFDDGVVLKPPFYYITEELNGKSQVICRFLDREPYSVGSVYGFYGLSFFKNYEYNIPILVTEGPADWAALRTIYPYVLCSKTVGLGMYQKYILKHLTDNVILCFDKDEPGQVASQRITDSRMFNTCILTPPAKDYGNLLESDWGINLLERTKSNLIKVLCKWGYLYEEIIRKQKEE